MTNPKSSVEHNLHLAVKEADWPVRQQPPWIQPRGAAEAFEEVGWIPMPAQGLQAVVLSFRVPASRHGAIWKVGNEFSPAAGWTPGNGQIVWQIKIATHIVPNFENMLSTIGTVTAPRSLSAPLRCQQDDLIQFLVTNVGITNPAGQRIGCTLGGFYYPADLDPQGTWQ